MKTKVIKTEAAYEAALERINEIFDAKPGTPEGDELELLGTLVEVYENNNFPVDPPDPRSAIRFRMEQQGLKAKDLVPYVGSASKVSEVLSGRRDLSVAMIRRLVEGLGIPAKALLKAPETKINLAEAHKFPIGEMAKRGWFANFSGTVQDAKNQFPELFEAFLRLAGGSEIRTVLNRQRIRSGPQMDPYALEAWRIRVIALALAKKLPPYKKGAVTLSFLRELVHLSYLSEGPRLAQEFLNKQGIHLVVEQHLPGMFLDGAALRLPDGSPVIAVTLRYDRLDSFWLTLCHECAHVALDLDKNGAEAFFDDLTKNGNDPCEKKVDKLASEALIPGKQWAESGLAENHTPKAVRDFAEKLRINPAIPAGRIRFEKNDYTILKDLVGSGMVRPLFGWASN